MRNLVSLAYPCLLAVSLAGCYQAELLRPVQGPAVAQSRVINIKISGVFNSGSLKADLKANQVWHTEACNGRWEPAGDSETKAANDMTEAWDTVYGSGYYAERVAKAKRRARGSCTSKQGTTLDVEVFEFEDSKNGRMIRQGVGKDSRGNIYKLG